MKEKDEIDLCQAEYVLAINDTLNVITGKWKLPIIGALLYGKMRYSEIQKNIPKISPRMLSKELKELEINGIVLREVKSTIPVSVEYQLTVSGENLRQVLNEMVHWGNSHRDFAGYGKQKAG